MIRNEITKYILILLLDAKDSEIVLVMHKRDFLIATNFFSIVKCFRKSTYGHIKINTHTIIISAIEGLNTALIDVR